MITETRKYANLHSIVTYMCCQFESMGHLTLGPLRGGGQNNLHYDLWPLFSNDWSKNTFVKTVDISLTDIIVKTNSSPWLGKF